MADPDLQDKGEGEPDHLYPEIMGGGGEGRSGFKKDFFWPFGPQFGIKISEERVGTSPGSSSAVGKLRR